MMSLHIGRHEAASLAPPPPARGERLEGQASSAPRRKTPDPDGIVPILRSGILAREFCQHDARAEIAAVFDRSFCLRAGDTFICVGAPVIGNGPLTLIANSSCLPTNL
jgi:hypothetical protein